jgi:hypothetical protein
MIFTKRWTKNSLGNSQLKKLVLSLLCLMPISNAMASRWAYLYGEGEELCDGLIRHLEKYSYPNPKKLSNSCTWDVAVSYPGFSEPPWEELDIKQHENLIYKLTKYAWAGGEPEKVFPQQEQFIRQDVRKFVEQGGHLQLWRTRLIHDFRRKTSFVIWAPPGEQNVIQLRHSYELQTKRKPYGPCGKVPEGMWGRLFIANEDITDVHPDIGYSGMKLAWKTLVIYRGKPYFLSREGSSVITVARDNGSGPSDFCELHLVRFK